MANPWEQDWARTPDAEDGPWALGWAKPAAPAKTSVGEDLKDVGTAVVEGVSGTGRSLKAAGQALIGDLSGVERTAESARQAELGSKAESLTAIKRDLAERKAAGDDTIWQGVKNVAGAAANNPMGAAQLVAEQLPNSAVALGAGFAGLKAGAAAAPFLGPLAPLAPIAGGLIGMFLGNTSLETGGKALEKAGDGFTPEDRSAALREGAVKGAVVTGVDAATLGVTKLLYSPVGRAMEQAGADALARAGVNTADRKAVEAAIADPAMKSQVEAAQAAAYKQAQSGGRGAARGTGALALESVGEGVGEGAGEYAATGKFSPTEAVTEAVAGLGQSAAEVAFVKGKATAGGLIADQRGAPPAATAADNLTGLVDEYLRGPSAAEVASSILSTPDVDSAIAAAEAATRSFAEVAREKGAALAPVMDRQAVLTAQANAAGTEAERAGAQQQAAVALETATQPVQGAAQQFEDLTPMDKRTAEGRLRVLRDMTANEGGDALSLSIVAHPSSQGKYAIGRTAPLPSLEVATQPAVATSNPAETQQRLESAALAGTETQRKLQDEGRQIALTRALKNVEERGGVASPAEARIFQEAGVGKPYDRIDESLAPALTTDQTLTQATGIALDKAPRSSTTQTSSPSEQQMAQGEQQARGDSRLQQIARDRQALEDARGDAARMGPPAKPEQAPNLDGLTSILRKDPALWNAQEKVLVDGARRQLGERFGLVERAARAPQTLSAEERLQLRGMREGGVVASAQREEGGQPLQYQHSESRLETGRGTMDAGQYTLIRNLARVFGKKVQVFSSDREDAPDGYVLRSDARTIYLNDKSQVSHLVVFGHELMHQLKKDNPKAYDAIAKVIQLKKDANLDVAGINGDMEEFTSDLLGNRFREPAFWAEVFDQLNDKPAAARLAAEIGRVIDRLVKTLRGLTGFSTDKMVANLEEVRGALKDALATYARDQYGEAQALDREGDSRFANRESVAAVDTSEERVENRTGSVQVAVKPDRTERRRLAAEAARRDMGARFSEQRENNASGESAASLEALSRDRQERAAGQQRVRISRAGAVTPLIGPSAVDARARAGSGDVILQRGVGKAEWTVLDQDPALGKSAVARATQLAPKFSEKRDLFPEEFADKNATTPTKRLISSRGDAELGGNVNSAGQQIQATKQGLANFWRWFAGSQATDAKGRPLVLYHSTNADVDVLRRGEKSSNNYGLLGSFEVSRAGIFLTPDKDFSQEYLRSGSGQNVMPAYARLENPLDLRSGLSEQDEAALDDAGVSSRFIVNAQNYWELFDNDEDGVNWFVSALQVAGYDGAIFREASPSGETSGGTTYVVFDSEQVKSATGNNGRFDPASNDITKSAKRGQLDNVEAYHYSQEPRKVLNSGMFGTGLRGSAREDYLNAEDPRRRQRISFYFDKGTGIRPEAGVGGVPHRATLDNVYDSNADPLKLRSGSQAKFESAVLDAGFDGYLDRLEGTQPGQIIMLGKRTIPVQALPPGPVKSGAAVPALDSQPVQWETQSTGPSKDVLQTKADRLRQQPAWQGYEFRVTEAGKDFWKLESRKTPEAGATLNVGLSTAEVAGGGSITEDDVRAALERAGVEVLDLVVHQSSSEPTAVVTIDRPLTAAQGDALSRELQQEAVVQRLPDGSGELYGPKADAWGPYNPAYFVLPDGNTAGPAEEQIAASAKRTREELNPEIVATLGRHIRNLLPAERAKLRRNTAERLVDRIESLPSANEMAAVAYAGRAKRGWYEHSAFAIEHVFGADGPRFAALLAALSPQQSVEGNLYNALSTWKNWVLAGRPTGRAAIIDVLSESVQGGRGRASVLDAWINNSVRALSSEDPSSLTISGPKVNSFMLNLRGVVDEVTNDTWMANFALVDQTIFGGKLTVGGDPGKGTGYLAMSARVRETAKTLTRLTGETWTPAEVQETIWSWAKTLYETASVNKSAVEVLADGELTDDLINSTPDFRTLFHDEVHEQLLRDAGLGEQVSTLRGRARTRAAEREGSEAEGQAAPFAGDAQRRYERRAAQRLDELRARGLSEDDASVAYSAKRTFVLLHGGSDFEQVDKGMLGRGEPGGLRPLGNGFYGYLVRGRDMADIDRIVRATKAYVKYAPTEKRAVQAFKLELEPGEVWFAGRVWDENLLTPEQKARRDEWAAADAIPPGPERIAAFEELWRKYPGRSAAETRAEKNRTPIVTEMLGGGTGQFATPELLEAAVNDTGRLQRIGKWAPDTPDSKIGDDLHDAVIGKVDLAYSSKRDDDDLGKFRKDMLDRVATNVQYGQMLAKMHDWAYNVGDVFLSTKTGKTYTLTGRTFQRVGKLKDNNWRPVYSYSSGDPPPAGMSSAERSKWDETHEYQLGTFQEDVLKDSATMVNLTTPKMSQKRSNYGSPVNSVWQMPGMNRADNLVYTIQDKMVDTKRAIDAIKAGGRVVDEQFNAYDKETLYHGRTSKQTKDFHDTELRPLLEEMRAARVEIKEFEEYLHNRHAEERNEQVAKIGGMADGGSGIKTADARAYLAALPAAQRRVYDRLARRVDAITKGTRDYLVSTGLETQQTISSWEGAYSGYVPLNREEFEELGGGTGMGYSVRGPASKRALGSGKAVSNILGNVARQREAAIVRAEKNRVAKAVFGMLVKHPNTDLALPVDPALLSRDPQKSMADLIALGLSPFDARSIVEEPVQRMIDPRTGMIVERVNPTMRNRENVMGLRVNGEDRFIFFSETDERAQRMVRALKNLDAPALGEVMTIIGMGTRWLSSVNTQYNPVFGIFNFARDFGGAMVNLTSTPLAGAQKQIAGDALSALRGIYIDLRDHRAGKVPNSSWARLFEEFQREGGQTGYRDLFRTPQDRQADIEREFKILAEGKAKAVPRAMFQWLSDYNEAIENSIRLAAYKAAKDRGMTNQQAAVLAKNLTVNFNRKGEVATQAGALYGFFNAAVQGTDRLRQTLTGPAGKKILAGGLLLGALQAALLAAAGFDDEEPPEFTRDRSFIIPTGDGKYIAIPLPLGLHVLPAFARRTVEFAGRGFKDPAKYAGGQLGLLLDAFNPIGGGSDFIAAITPSVADPAIALARNQDWTGRPITREDFNSLKPTPGHTRSKDTATWLSTQLATFLNWSSGGTDFKPGMLSPTADQIDYLVGQAFGGVARELSKLEQTVTSPFTGEDLPSYKIPLVGRLVGNVNEAAAERGRYYENVRKLNMHESEIEGRKKSGQGATIREYLADNPEARMFEQAKSVEKQVQDLQQRKRQMRERGASPESIKLIDEAIVRSMKRLNDRMRRLEEAPA